MHKEQEVLFKTDNYLASRQIFALQHASSPEGVLLISALVLQWASKGLACWMRHARAGSSSLAVCTSLEMAAGEALSEMLLLAPAKIINPKLNGILLGQHARICSGNPALQ